jgi:hypothetical protein
MNRMDEALAAEADFVAAEVERTEGRRFERLRRVTRDGVAVAFYRGVEPNDSEGATLRDAPLLAVLLDEVSPGHWDALSAAPLRTGGSRSISMRPSERGDWVVAIYGSAPAGATVALLEYGGVQHRVAVEDHVFALMLRAPSEPEPTLTRPSFQ